ncbi:glycosyltransferase family 4 protein [Rubinisphaera margarita]|uniref:glycosyltransferase family 4 protein n=1 Tax=Rubinisphaera margarita TaxID=2909586 RepID=UPI001EE8839F|nr:glycosyltransferase family 4 protein [Rubinisphaera margarita]MCG6157947.1 glycosyltransferase family 4 protein [Rubinisphaera margarita]
MALIRQQFRLDGGGERIVAQMARVLHDHGHDVTLIARKWSGAAGSVLKCDPPKWTRVQRERRFAEEAMQIAQRQKFDLVQSHERIPGCQVYRAGDGVHASWLEQRSRTLSGWRRRLLLRNNYHRYVMRAERQMFEHPKLTTVICNARMIADEIVERFEIDPAKLQVIYNGVDTDRFHPELKSHRQQIREQYQIEPDSPLAVFVGSGWERKGLAVLLKAMRQVPAMNLIVVGRDKSHRQFEKQAEQCGIAARIRFAGVQPDVAPYYGAADLFVLPTLYDPFPNAVLEAMASGLPVLTTDTCGGAEFIRDGNSGYVRDALDTDGWIDALQACCDYDRTQQMGRESRRIVEPHTSLAMQQQLTSLYERLLQEAKS